jgi:hypothetical protein
VFRTVGVIVAAFAAVVVAAAPASGRQVATCPHDGTINGVPVLIACGPAKATVHFGGTRLSMRNGQCLKSSANFALNFGASRRRTFVEAAS